VPKVASYPLIVSKTKTIFEKYGKVLRLYPCGIKDVPTWKVTLNNPKVEESICGSIVIPDIAKVPKEIYIK